MVASASDSAIYGDGELNNELETTPEKPGNKQLNSNTSTRKKKKKVNDKVPYYKLFSFADPTDYVLMIVGTITAIGSGFSVPIMAVLFGELVNSLGQNSDTAKIVHSVSKVSLKFVCLALGSGVATASQVACWMATGERQAAQIRLLYLRAILRQDVGYFDKETTTGEIIERMSGDTLIIQDALGEKVGRFLQLLATFFGGIAIAMIKGWLLSLVLLSSIPLLVISAAVMTVLMAKLTSRKQTAYSAAATVVEQTIVSIRTVASFTGERLAITKYSKSLDEAYKSGVQEGLAAGLGSGVFMLIFLCSYALAVWVGAKMILEKAYTGGDVMNVIIAVLTGSFSLGQASPCLSAFAAGQATAFKMFQTIDRTPDIDTHSTKGQKSYIIGDVEFRDVYFSYPTRPEELVLNGFSFSISNGTTAALVGKSGCGKSTVISLIERFYDPQSGAVLIDGINIKEFDLRWIRGNISLVSQEPVLFATSIKENIAYGRDGATLEEIELAAKLANATTFIEKLPQGLDTVVGFHGAQISGGQKQRIAIARAILKDPRILLLDEATSALDAESERTVQEALDEVLVGRTTLIVAHRLSTIKNADIIAVIHQGKIVEKGLHFELLQDSKGPYSQLVQLQEINKVPEHIVIDQDQNEVVLNANIGRHSTQQVSLFQSKSQEASGISDNSHCSFSVSRGLPLANDVVELEMRKPHQPTWAPLQMDKQVILSRLAYMNKPEILELLLGSLAAAVNGLILPLIGEFHSQIIKSFYEPAHKLNKDSKFWASMYLALGGGCLLATPLRTYFFAVAGCKLIKRIRLMCFEKVVHMEISWFDKIENSSGAIGARLSIDATCVRTLVGESLALLVQNTITAIAGLVIGFLASWQLTLIIIVVLPLIGLNGYFQMKFINGISGDTKKLYEEATQVASDAVGSIRMVSAYCAEEKVMQLYGKKCEGPIRARIKQGLIGGGCFGLSMFFLYLVYAASFYIGAQFIEAQKITFVELFQVFYGLSMMAVGISQSGTLAPDSNKAMEGAASVFAFLNQQSDIDSSDDSGIILDCVKGDIEFHHVSFKYPNRPDVQILTDLCLAIRSGKTVALVGESGSGKSTVISLLQRFYDPDSGCITLDGVELQKLKLKWLRQQMGLVSQEPVLFNETIRANIAYGKEGDAMEAEILAAAETANAHEFISGLQKGYDTIVGERGIQLSGGQKQRVAIARAIVKDPKIILLDEPSSALDAESEKVVQGALDRAMMDKTTVVVAHRLSTIKDADLIAVIKDGIIAEQGNHETLINSKNGIYTSLVALHASSSSDQNTR